MPTVITEGAATFTFDDDWRVLELDQPGGFFVQRVQPLGVTKAVDILGVYQGRDLYFIEIKDYRGGVVELRANEKMHPGDALHTQLARKVKDSVSCIIGGYRTTGEDFWPPCAELTGNRHSILRCVFWIECDPLPNDAGMPQPRWQKRLRQRLATVRHRILQKLVWLTSEVTVVNQHSGAESVPGLTVAFA